MEAVLGLLVMSLLVSQGETLCDGRKNRTLCYGALGGTVVLQLMDNASEIPRYEWKNETTVILKGTNSSVITNHIEERSLFTLSNGTLMINNLNRKDSGIYTLKLFDKDLRISEERTLNLSIQAPVTSVQLTPECLFEGEKRISCSAGGGDSPQFSWTLDGRRLTEEELVSGADETNSVTLKLNVSGQLVCWVHNNVSNASGTMELDTCGDYLSILAGVLATLVILIVVALLIIYFLKKKQHNKTKEEDDGHELTYADVRIVQQQRRPVGHRPEPEVEYGQVKFSERPRQPGARTDDCVYSEVRKAR
ncbi:hepatocyte cell adhesion molecule isoform X3 [Salarias fasciatus]|uniref:hepatocyte cell adhesion molecule isoform X3 n=1 Tax=Salarias fasciatus TaxID=181472 RepID=UPI0011767874|nr:hepatocyte cell adhesion molecule-like isoform X3 [Salarias fasciatus]